MAVPSIPPRPSRSSNMPAASEKLDLPQVPARPRRSVERSVSPERDRFAPSPLNSGFGLKKLPSIDRPSGLSRELPVRPPSVTLPSVGQEGSEYDHATPAPEQEQADPMDEAKTSSVANELPLHAPKASLPAASAKQRIAAVTRTDSEQAAALGIGKAHSNASETDLGSTLARSSSRQSQTRSRPPSLYKQDSQSHEQLEEVGIPHIGVHVPMYPNAGDVQAPTPSPGMMTPSQGVGFFNNGGSATPKHHSRTKSGRDVFHGPPGSYGLHGHGVNKADPFEKDWYEKHPEAHAREKKGEYGPAISEDRKEWALSSEELNKLVHTKSHTGMGASNHAIGTPAEDIGYIASEEYTQRLASRPPSAKPRRPSSQTFTESPLRKMSLPAQDLENAVKQVNTGKHDGAVESEAEDDVIHVDMPRSPRRFADNKSVEDLGLTGGNTAAKGGHYLETGDAPILASDEAAYRPDAKYLQPAIEPEYERRNSSYLDLGESLGRPHSRSSSINQISENHLAQTVSRSEHRPDSVGTPLPDVKEYEPLFDDDEDEPRSSTAPAATGSSEKKLLAKRPDLARHQFPSQDVWEDTPASLQYVTTVDTEQAPDDSHPAAEHEPEGFFESPEVEQARRDNITAKDQENFLPAATKNLAKNRYKTEVVGEVPTRPGTQQRFPSQDIWEDTPSSQMYTTVLEGEDDTAPAEAKPPQVPARPAKKTSADTSPVDAKQAPVIPGRPKPTVPARPSKLRSSADGVDDAPLSKSISKDSNDSTGSASTAKAKPAVPARPAGGKIAALQANFMSDLNKKLGLGPQAPKKEEPEPEAVEEKAPLADARKGRARGPQRRRAAASSPSGAGEDYVAAAPPPTSSRPVFRFTISRPQTIWEVDEGVLSVPIAAPSVETARAVTEAAEKGQAAAIEFTHEEGSTATEKGMEVPGAFKEEEEEEAVKLEDASTKESSEKLESAVQTGETHIEATDPKTGEVEKATAFVGGKAPEEGTVIVGDDGKELGGASS